MQASTSLEKIVEKQSNASVWSKRAKDALGFVLPFLQKYDAKEQADVLLKDPQLATLVNAGYLNRENVAPYLEQAYQANRKLVGFAMLADTSDRATSLAVMIPEVIGTITGGAPGMIINGGEEFVELGLKAPCLYSLLTSTNADTKSDAYKLLAIELSTSALPGVGDAVDAATNLYMRAAYKHIRSEAKNRILADARNSLPAQR